jgi:hypothetical protein
MADMSANGIREILFAETKKKMAKKEEKAMQERATDNAWLCAQRSWEQEMAHPLGHRSHTRHLYHDIDDLDRLWFVSREKDTRAYAYVAVELLKKSRNHEQLKRIFENTEDVGLQLSIAEHLISECFELNGIVGKTLGDIAMKYGSNEKRDTQLKRHVETETQEKEKKEKEPDILQDVLSQEFLACLEKDDDGQWGNTKHDPTTTWTL